MRFKSKGLNRDGVYKFYVDMDNSKQSKLLHHKSDHCSKLLTRATTANSNLYRLFKNDDDDDDDDTCHSDDVAPNVVVIAAKRAKVKEAEQGVRHRERPEVRGQEISTTRPYHFEVAVQRVKSFT